MNKYLKIALLITLLGLSTCAQAVNYTASNLDTFYGYSLNDLGQIAGYTRIGSRFQAAVREGNGTISYLPSTANDSFAFAISNTGYVVGMSGSEGFVWNGHDPLQKLEGLGIKDAPRTVSNDGEAVGWSANADYSQRAAIWDQGGAFMVIPGLPNEGEIIDINDQDQVIGRESSAGSFLWSKSDLEYFSFEAMAINNSGWIAGTDFSMSYSRAVVWKPGIGLGFLDALPGWANSSLVDINDLGQILGQATIEGNSHIIVWNSDGSIDDLGIGEALSINNLGQILSTDTLWTPVPEPSSLLVLSGALLTGIGCAKAGRRCNRRTR